MGEAEIKIIVGSVGIGIFFMGRAIKRRRTVQKITDSPRSRIESAPQGQVEIQGFAWALSEGFLTPRNDEAIYYSLEIQKKVSEGSGKNRRTKWKTIASHVHAFPFYAVDATGLAIVEPETAEFEFGSKTTRGWSGLSRAEKEGVLRILGGRTGDGFPPSDGFFGIFASSYRVVETEILLGHPIYANGDFVTSHTEELKVTCAGLTEFHRRVFDAGTRDFKKISHFLDKNRDGITSEEEARHGYSFAARTARKRVPAPGTAETAFEVHGRLRSSPTTRILIGDCHENHLKQRLERWTTLQFLGGAALITLGVMLALTSTGVIPFQAFKIFAPQDRRPVSVYPNR